MSTCGKVLAISLLAFPAFAQQVDNEQLVQGYAADIASIMQSMQEINATRVEHGLPPLPMPQLLTVDEFRKLASPAPEPIEPARVSEALRDFLQQQRR